MASLSKWESALAAAVYLIGSTACGRTEDKGELVVAIQTDMKVPEDVDQVRFEISTFGKPLFRREYPVGPDGVRIPATITVVEGEDSSTPVTISLSARQRGKIRMLREAVTTVPPSRSAMLPLPIQWLCDGSGFESAPNEIDSSCPRGQTCVSGLCEPATIDSRTLPDFTPTAIFGGGTAEDGSCFDTVACFAQGAAAEVTLDGCTIPIPAAATGAFDPSVAIVTPPGSDGICGRDVCLVPLDAGSVWKQQDGRIVLPQPVCDRINDGRALGVAVTRACDQKTSSLPTCGPWSAITGTEATFDAGAPSNVDLSSLPPPPCAPPTDASRASLCLDLEPEAVTAVAGNPELDGLGKLVVEVYDVASLPLDPAAVPPTPIASFTLPNDGTETSIDQVNSARFDDLPPGPVYVLAAFWDNASETSLAALKRGGGWVGGLDLSSGLSGQLTEWTLAAGEGNNVTLPLRAIRRLEVSALLGAGVNPADDGIGWVSWAAFGSSMPQTSAAALGRGMATCADLGVGSSTASEGYVIGGGPHHIVAWLDDFGLQSGNALGSLAGSLLSGSPAPPDAWSVPASDVMSFPESSYLRTFSLALTHLVSPGAPPPATFQCPTGNCSDGLRNGAETDADCGGPCSPCADGLACAGPADCLSRVCTAWVCASSSCTDGLQNGAETDLDCGGACSPCAAGQGCQLGSDCASGSCVLSVCATGVDAGGIP